METLWNIIALWNMVTLWNMMTLLVYDDIMKYIVTGNSKVVKCGNKKKLIISFRY